MAQGERQEDPPRHTEPNPSCLLLHHSQTSTGRYCRGTFAKKRFADALCNGLDVCHMMRASDSQRESMVFSHCILVRVENLTQDWSPGSSPYSPPCTSLWNSFQRQLSKCFLSSWRPSSLIVHRLDRWASIDQFIVCMPLNWIGGKKNRLQGYTTARVHMHIYMPWPFPPRCFFLDQRYLPSIIKMHIKHPGPTLGTPALQRSA